MKKIICCNQCLKLVKMERNYRWCSKSKKFILKSNFLVKSFSLFILRLNKMKLRNLIIRKENAKILKKNLKLKLLCIRIK